MPSYRRGRFVLVRAAAVALLALQAANVLAVDYFWDVGTGDWTADGNWDQGLSPIASFEELGIINNGGTATVSSLAPDAAGLVLGQNDGNSGTLIVESGGSLTLVETLGAAALVPPVGVANIGLDGVGKLQVLGGGAFSTTSLDVNPGSTVEIGGGVGAASIASTDSMYLNGVTITHGPDHTFSADGFVEFEGSSQYIVDLRAATHTALTTPGPIRNVQGLLSIQTSGGYTPTAGDSWRLLSGASITGAGFVVDTTLSTVPAGHAYRTQVHGGGNGTVLDLVYERYASLQVNTSTGAVSMVSASGAAIDILGYSVLSEAGSLIPANWTSLTDQAVAGFEEAGTPSAQSLNELNAQGSFSLTGATIQLGNVYNLPEVFGEDPGEIAFEYAVDGAATSVQGIVEYTGNAAANNLLLTINPTTGESQLQNSSRFSIDLLGYSILSGAGSLVGANWTSLESQSVPGWDEATPASNSSFALSELTPEGVATLFPGEAFSLGQMFSVGSARDLELEFVLSVDGVEEVRTGVVKYGMIAEVVSVPGDYNNDGVVNAADYTVWRDRVGPGSLPNEGGVSPGVVDQADYNFWASRYGATSAAQTPTVSVPEASGAALLLAVCVGGAFGRPKAKP